VVFEKKRESLLKVILKLNKVFRVKSIGQRSKSQQLILTEQNQERVRLQSKSFNPLTSGMLVLSPQIRSGRVLSDLHDQTPVCFSADASFDLTKSCLALRLSKHFRMKVVNTSKLEVNFQKNLESLKGALVKHGLSNEYFNGEVHFLEKGFWFVAKKVLYWVGPRVRFLFYQNLNLGKCVYYLLFCLTL
jgi:hypothetical protein